MRKNPFFGTLLLSLLLLSASCKKEIRNVQAEENSGSPSENALVTKADKAPAAAKELQNDLLKSVRAATARFHSTTQAEKAGYVADKECVYVEGLGGMGYHWLNLSLVDAVFDPLKPEAVLYATGPGGNLRLVAVEYLVLNVGQPRPMFGSHPFDIEGAPLPVPHWTLHVWLYEHNPSGLFAPFNPTITCP